MKRSRKSSTEATAAAIRKTDTSIGQKGTVRRLFPLPG